MRALEYDPTLPGYALARLTGGTRGGPLALLRHAHRPPPPLPSPDWVRIRPRLAGICGSDLAALGGHAGAYLGALASTPFIPGHEIVADCLDGALSGRRVVVEPLLHCAVRNLQPLCSRCAVGEPQGCEQVMDGELGAGLQTGYCAATGGGWGTELVAHPSQLHVVPDQMEDADAVLVEPLACALHAVMRAGISADDRVLVLGAGTMGLLCVAALRSVTAPRRLLAVARHDHQRAIAQTWGADAVLDPEPTSLIRAVRRETRARLVEGRVGKPFLLGGVDVVLECTGTASGLRDAMAVTRAGGTIVMVGMPGGAGIDLSPAWQRELRLHGAYGYGVEGSDGSPGGRRRSFAHAMDLAASLRPGHLVAPAHPLRQWRAAIAEASTAGRRGLVKVAFAPQAEAA